MKRLRNLCWGDGVVGEGEDFTACGKTTIKAGFGKGTSFTRAVKSLEMCLRLSARGELLVPSKTFFATCLLVPLSRWTCVCASAPDVCFLRRVEFFRNLFSGCVRADVLPLRWNEDLENAAPEERTNLAQRFSAGKSGKNDLSPGWTTQ